MMRVKFDQYSDLWEVTEGHRYWTVNAGGGIFNEHLREVKPTGALGKRISAAVSRFRRFDEATREEGEK